MKKAAFFSFMLLTVVLWKPDCHPHIFIDPAVTVIQTETGVGGVRLVWTWDNSWSYLILRKCDLNEDGIFTGREIELVYNDFFRELEELDYFCSISINGEHHELGGAEQFTVVSTREQIVTFLFVIPLTFPILDSADVKVVFNDDSWTAAFTRNVRVRTESGVPIDSLRTEQVRPFGVQASFTLTAESSNSVKSAR